MCRKMQSFVSQNFLGGIVCSWFIGKILCISCSPSYNQQYSKHTNTWKHYNTFPTPSAPSGPYIPGAQRLFVSVDGTMYPCERASEVSSILSIGNIYNGFNYSASQKMLNIAKITESHCSKCWAFHFCGGCIRDTFDGSGIPSAQKRLSKCYSYRTMGDVILYGTEMLREIPLYYREQLQEATK